MSIPTRTLGRTGLTVGRLGLGSSYGVREKDVEWAFDQGCNYLYWGSLRRGSFGDALRHLVATRRDELVLVVQSYARMGWLVRRSLEKALRRLGAECADVLLLGMWNKPISPKILETADRLRQAGKFRFLAASTHQRKQAGMWLEDETSPLDVLHVRYNAVHRGAETEVFPYAGEGRQGLVSFTATRWGMLCRPGVDEAYTPSAGDCYRFVLSHPAVDVCLAGPKNRAELEAAIAAAEAGPLDAPTMDRMRAVGDRLYEARKGRGETTFLRR